LTDSKSGPRPSSGHIVVLGGLNMDLMIETPRPAGPGETTEGTRFYTAPGGKGGNQAVAAARLSQSPGTMRMVGRVGNDPFGEQMRGFLENEGIDTTHLANDPDTASGIAAIFIDASGENYVNAVYGANARCNEEQVAAACKALEGASVLLAQQEVPLGVTYEVMKVAKKMGVTIILDPAPTRDVPDGFYDYPDILTPNQGEAESLSGIAVVDEASAAVASKIIREQGTPIVIVTMGEHGAHIEAEDVSLYLPAHNVKVVASVAAGDAFNGGLAVGIAEGMALVDAARLGMASGAFCVSKDGAQEAMGTRYEVNALMQQLPG
jgi:ribokinase